MYHRTVALLELEADLRKAVDQNEFFLQYQPIVSLDTGHLVSLEALIRWQHPKRGLVPPGDFIPLAEETGMIVPIGEWVLRKACEQVAEWKKCGPSPVVAVNVSGHQLRQTNFTRILQDILNEFSLVPQCLEVEITETVLMDNMEQANNVLNELKKMGFYISLDDFGTGYSSLAYLQQFPVQKLKVDRSFIMKLGADPENTEIVNAILQLAQGFYFARPTSVDDMRLTCS
jgi:EAL domain-containing protein (putative c-di-GMP-specific phosphodiesterase class I)